MDSYYLISLLLNLYIYFLTEKAIKYVTPSSNTTTYESLVQKRKQGVSDTMNNLTILLRSSSMM